MDAPFFRLDGPYDKEKGLLLDKKKNILLDIYAKAVTGQSVWGMPKKKERVLIRPGWSRTTSTGAQSLFPQIPMEGVW